ncbi:hypothetical protein Tco_0088046 [Tanacetum coccineum]
MLRTCYGHDLTKGAIIQIFYHGLDDPNQEILDARGISLDKTLNEAFKILEGKGIIKLDFKKSSQNNPNLKTVVSAGGSNIIFDYEVLMEKFKALTTKIDTEFMNIRGELEGMQNDYRDDGGNHASKIYESDDTPMCDPIEAYYSKHGGYHGGYHDQNSRISYSYPNHNPTHNYHHLRPQNRMPHPSQYYKLSKASMEEMMKEWMASQIEANENMKNHVVELERQIMQGLKNYQSIIEHF